MDLEFLLDLGYIGLFIGTFIAASYPGSAPPPATGWEA